MVESKTPKLSKWPFFVGDVALVAVAWLIYRQGPLPLAPAQIAIAAACLGLGAILATIPFLVEYRAAVRLAECEELSSTMAEFKKLEFLTHEITGITGRWQVAQEAADKTVGAARQISERMASEAREFAESMKRANDAEKGNLRLEVEKLHRAQGDWLQVVVRMLDHVYALHTGAVRAGQANVIEQVSQFQRACRDVTRRIGLVPFLPNRGDAFDSEKHQVVNSKEEPDPGALVGEIVATGYTFQGKMLRPALVTLHTEIQPPTAAAPEPETTPDVATPSESSGTAEV